MPVLLNVSSKFRLVVSLRYLPTNVNAEVWIRECMSKPVPYQTGPTCRIQTFDTHHARRVYSDSVVNSMSPGDDTQTHALAFSIAVEPDQKKSLVTRGYPQFKKLSRTFRFPRDMLVLKAYKRTYVINKLIETTDIVLA